MASSRSRVVPEDLLRDAQYGRFRFLSMYGDTLLLLVTLSPEQPELETGLAFASSETTIESQRPSGQPLQYRTQLQSVGEYEPFTASRNLDVGTLKSRLRKDRHFIVPLRKRQDSGTLSADRITIGRAFNQDIVLRHGSVSKFHAWVEMSDTEGARVADAGSRNGTRVNDESLAPRTPVGIQPGDVVRVGSVNTMVCDPETLFEVLTSM